MTITLEQADLWLKNHNAKVEFFPGGCWMWWKPDDHFRRVSHYGITLREAIVKAMEAGNDR